MPTVFYDDTDQNGSCDPETRCLEEVSMFDGPGICKRKKGHQVDDFADGGGVLGKELHQEEYEGWVWDINGTFA